MKTGKKVLAALFAALMLVSLAACAARASEPEQPAQPENTNQEAAQQPAQPAQNEPDAAAPDAPEEPEEPDTPEEAEEPDTPQTEDTGAQPEEDAPEGGKTLVVYYSASGYTEAVAQTIADTLGADIFELVPTQPYSSEDLDWTDRNSRVSSEYADESLREVALERSKVENWDAYDTVFIGYPIWWGIAAWPVDGFVTGNDFTGKTVIPFCTSSSSGLGQSGELLAEMAGTGNWLEGQRFRSGVSAGDVQNWLADLEL